MLASLHHAYYQINKRHHSYLKKMWKKSFNNRIEIYKRSWMSVGDSNLFLKRTSIAITNNKKMCFNFFLYKQNEKRKNFFIPLAHAMQKKTRVNPFYSRLFRSYIAVTKPFNTCKSQIIFNIPLFS